MSYIEEVTNAINQAEARIAAQRKIISQLDSLHHPSADGLGKRTGAGAGAGTEDDVTLGILEQYSTMVDEDEKEENWAQSDSSEKSPISPTTSGSSSHRDHVAGASLTANTAFQRTRTFTSSDKKSFTEKLADKALGYSLLVAAKNGDIHKATKILYGHNTVSKLSTGVDIDYKNSYGLTPLHWAMARGDKRMAQLLLDCGADWTCKNVNGQTAADVATHASVKNLISEYKLRRAMMPKAEQLKATNAD